MAKVAPHDPAKRALIEQQADEIAGILGVDEEEVMIDGRYGVMLKPEQAARLIVLARTAKEAGA